MLFLENIIWDHKTEAVLDLIAVSYNTEVFLFFKPAATSVTVWCRVFR